MNPEAIDTEPKLPRRPDARVKPTWETPRIKCVARVRDCVQGFGKTGPTPDSDPNSTTKSGVG